MKTEIKKPKISYYIDYLTEKEEILNLEDKSRYKGSLLGGYFMPKYKPFRELHLQKLKEFKIKYQYKGSLYRLSNIIKKRVKK